MSYVECPNENCEETLKLGKGFSDCEISRCICHNTNLVVTSKERARKLLRFDYRTAKYSGQTLKKDDLVIIEHPYRCNGKENNYFTAAYVGYGGKKPREETRAPIDISRVVAVIRPGWRLKYYTEPADTVEEAINIAWGNRRKGNEKRREG